MSRSYRKPYATWVACNRSSSGDKKIANRVVRHTTRLLIKKTEDFQDFILPHHYECSHNDVWDWNRDGNPHRVSPYYNEVPETFIEIDELTQVERVLDGEPAIYKRFGSRWTEEKQFEYYKKVQRK